MKLKANFVPLVELKSIFDPIWTTKSSTLGLAHMRSQVPTPLIFASANMDSGKVPTFEPHETIKIWFIFIEVGS